MRNADTRQQISSVLKESLNMKSQKKDGIEQKSKRKFYESE